MSLQIVRFTTDPDDAAAVEEGVDRLFRAVRSAQPDGMRYLATRHGERPEFLLLLHLAEPTANPLLTLPEAAAFREHMAGWARSRPAPEELTVLGSYRMAL